MTFINCFSCAQVAEPTILQISPSESVFYVSPSGSDANPGTQTKPWKSFAKAADFLQAGDTAVFEDGVYNETTISTFAHSGSIGKPIVVKARNKHQAKIVFPASTKDVQKINIFDVGFIEIHDFEITQVEKSINKTTDIFIGVRNSTDCKFMGNKIHYCLEEGIKMSRGSTNMWIIDNEISDTQHEGIDVLNVENVIIEGNRVYETGRVGIMVKGGARNVQVYNNIVKNAKKNTASYGITIGGVTNNTSPYDISIDGYEAYNVFVLNNAVIAESPGTIASGIAFIGAKDSHAHNNIIVGTKYAINFRSPPGIRNGWDWDPIVVNPHIRNNIMMDIETSAFTQNHVPVNVDSDYNLYHNIGGTVPTEANSVYADPFVVDPTNDWQLNPGSPALGSGFALPDTFDGFDNTEVVIDFKTFDGAPRGTNWNIGIY